MNLRSSAPNTSDEPRAVSVAPSPARIRRAPHCRHCKRPKAGHPRSGCPYVKANNTVLAGEATHDPSELITDALRSLQITPSIDDADKHKSTTRPPTSTRKPPATAPRHSLSTSAGEIFERLKRQDETQEDYGTERRHSKVTGVVQWRSAVEAAMTGESETSDHAPYGRSSQDPIVLTIAPPEGTRSVSHSNPSSVSSVHTTRVTRASTTKPLTRSMSAEEREAFVKSLNQESRATVYVLPKVDVFDVQESATKLGFRTRVVMSNEDEDPQALLALARDEDAVNWLSGRIEKEDREAIIDREQDLHSTRSFSLSALASGAVLGAVGAWAGLAFV